MIKMTFAFPPGLKIQDIRLKTLDFKKNDC